MFLFCIPDEKMPLTNAEKQRRYREKLNQDPSRRAQYLTKKRAKYHEDLAVGKRKNIGNMSAREKRNQRKIWRKQKQSYRKNLKAAAAELAVIPTPPASPELQINNPHINNSTRRRRRNIAKCYRDNQALRTQLEKQRRLTQKYKMRFKREKDRHSHLKTDDTPRKKTERLLRLWGRSNSKSMSRQDRRGARKRTKTEVRKSLLLNFVLLKEMRIKYMKGSRSQKKSLSDIVTGRIMRKYKLMAKANIEIGIGRKDSGNKKQRGTVTQRMLYEVRKFYFRDDNSFLTSGIKETVTKGKLKMQRRIMTDTLSRLHQKFLIENKDTQISLASFCRLRPFWVLPAKDKDRDTCACKQHENMKFIVNALHKKKVLETASLHEILTSLVCDIASYDCMYEKCQKCCHKEIIEQNSEKFDNTEEIRWFQWFSKKEKRMIKNEEKEITLTVKEEMSGNIGYLVDKFAEEISRFKKHYFNISNQLRHCRQLKEEIKPNEAVIHIDFSENFVCKHAKEIQGMHFGASKRQITLHTGVYYTGSEKKPHCFSSVSDSLEHGPSAIWCHIDPVLDEIQERNPEIDTIHFVSDGPSNQYKQKANFYLLTKNMSERGIKLATWNFHESGHGKGAPDGVGGTLKRLANQYVSQGGDITDSSSFVKCLQAKTLNITLYEISQETIERNKEFVSSLRLKAVPGTHKLHQIVTTELGEISYRDLSCFCRDSKPHSGHDFRCFTFNRVDNDNKTMSNKVKPSKHESKQPESIVIDKSLSNEKIAKNQKTAPRETSESDRQNYFDSILNRLSQCNSFKDIEMICNSEQRNIEQFDINYNHMSSIISTGHHVDEHALEIYPEDTEQNSVLFPVRVSADGNCLPYTGSILAFGHEKNGKEMRVRIIVESVLHKDLYLSQEYLERGLNGNPPNRDIAKTMAMYSDEFNINQKLDKQEVDFIYQREIMNITKDKTYMGMWQVFALASVLCKPTYSVYPNLGNKNVRKDLHRLVLPREERSDSAVYIMWTTTRGDMVQQHWVPNHFVAVLPIEAKDTGMTIAMQRWRLMRQRKLEKDKAVKIKETIKPTEGQNVTNDIHSVLPESEQNNTSQEIKIEVLELENKEGKNETGNQCGILIDESNESQPFEREQPKESDNDNIQITPNTELQQDSYFVEKQTTIPNELKSLNSVNESNNASTENSESDEKVIDESMKKADINIDESVFEFELEDILEKYVIVNYFGQLYPGYVFDIDQGEGEAHVRCMHSAGKSFYWPKAVIDECWYCMDNVLSIIPKPEEIKGKYQIDKDIWDETCRRFKNKH